LEILKSTPYSPSDCDIRISVGGHKFSHSEVAWLLALNGTTGKAQRLDRSPSARNPLFLGLKNPRPKE